jgi:hypothetical protein
MPVPSDTTPGPYKPDHKLRRIKHPLFKEGQAATLYGSIDELENHINKVKTCPGDRPTTLIFLCSADTTGQVISYVFRHVPAPPTVTFERELVFVYSDLNDENFMFNTDDDGRLRLYIIDFEHASFLPVSFLSYVVLQHKQWWSVPPIAERIGGTLPKENLEPMSHAFYVFQTFWDGVGLDVKSRKKGAPPLLNAH